jgi:hypothetical protein
MLRTRVNRCGAQLVCKLLIRQIDVFYPNFSAFLRIFGDMDARDTKSIWVRIVRDQKRNSDASH